MVGLAAIVLIVGLFVIGQYHEKKHPSFDWLSYFVIAAAMVIFSIGFDQISNGLNNIWFWVSMLAVALLIYVFIKLSKVSKKKN